MNVHTTQIYQLSITVFGKQNLIILLAFRNRTFQ